MRAGGVLRAAGRPAGALFESMESRLLLSGAFDTVGLTTLRNDAAFAGIDGSGIGVAILDTGIFSTHQDLAPNFVKWYDAVRRTETSTPFDPNGHGTHVAGTAAARNPEIGVATQARLIGVRVLPDDNEARPRHDTVADGLQWVIDNQARFNIRVVNMSLGTRQNFNSVPSDSSGEAALIRQLERLGVTVVSASGNSYADFASPGAAAPAVFSTLSVASTWEDDGVGDEFPIFAGGGGPFAAFEREGRRDRFAASSQRSTLANQVAAPGQTITSAWNGAGGQLYNTISGTSMAAPLVAGLVALMQDAARTFGGRFLSVSEVVSIVRETADTIIDSNVTTNGRIRISDRQVQDLPETGASFKRINAYNAIRSVRMLLTGNDGPAPVPGDADNTTAKAIALGRTDGNNNLGIEGAIGTDGTLQSGAADVDLYRFELASRGNLTIVLTNAPGGTAFDSFLRLFSANGAELASNDDAGVGNPYSAITTAILEPGTYFVGVSASDNSAYNAATGAGIVAGVGTGDYTLILQLSNPDPNGVVTGAVVVSKLPVLREGRIGSDLGVTVGSKDVDFFLVTAPDDGIITFDVDTDLFGDAGVDAVLRLFDESFVEVAFNDDRVDGDRDPLINFSVQRGQRIYVGVADYDNRAFDPHDPFSRITTGRGGDYDLTILFGNGDSDGTVLSARTGTLGATMLGAVGSDGPGAVGADGSLDVDFFEFTPASGGIIDLRVTSPDGSLRSSLILWTYDPLQDDVVRLGEAAGDVPVLRAFVSPGVTYFVSVSGEGNNDFDWFAPATGTGGDTGNYVLDARLRRNTFAKALTDDSVQRNTPVSIGIGDQFKGEIGRDGDFVVGAADVDVFRFVSTVRQKVIIRTFTSAEDATDTVLRIFDQDGRQIRFSDDVSSTDRGSRVSFTAEAGRTYFIGVNGYSLDAGRYNVINGDGAAEGETGSYVLVVRPGAGPEIGVEGLNGVPIVSGDSTPAPIDGTSFGSVSVTEGSIVREFVIRNSGNRNLTLAGSPRVAISGDHAGDFRVTRLPARVLAGSLEAASTFRVRFTPGAAGLRRANITILSNDLDEGTYVFAISGRGVLQPEISITGPGGAVIRAGDLSPRAGDGTDFGAVTPGQFVDRSFMILNTGRRPLRLTGSPAVLLSGDGAGDFSVFRLPGGSVPPGGGSRFTIRFTAGAVGRRDALVSIMNNDASEPVYTFAITATSTV